MNKQSLEIMMKLLKPVTLDEAAKVALARTGPCGQEQLWLSDAGLEEEVRALLAEKSLNGNS